MRKRINIIIIILITIESFLNFNCASIIHGNKQFLPISSNPTGAQVTVDGQVYYTSPCIIELERDKPYIVTVSMEGYQTEQVKIERGFSVWFFVGIIPGLILPGPIYDLVSGSAYHLTPESVSINLKKIKNR